MGNNTETDPQLDNVHSETLEYWVLDGYLHHPHNPQGSDMEEKAESLDEEYCKETVSFRHNRTKAHKHTWTQWAVVALTGQGSRAETEKLIDMGTCL